MSWSDPRCVHLDSAQLRVLAHPLRSRLLAALRAFGAATATELAQRLQTNSVNGQEDLPAGGHEFCPVVATSSAR